MTTKHTNAALTRKGFDNQERNLTFVKTDFQGLKLKFHACNLKQAFYPFHRVPLTKQEYFYISFSFGTWLSNLQA